MSCKSKKKKKTILNLRSAFAGKNVEACTCEIEHTVFLISALLGSTAVIHKHCFLQARTYCFLILFGLSICEPLQLQMMQMSLKVEIICENFHGRMEAIYSQREKNLFCFLHLQLWRRISKRFSKSPLYP